MERKKESLGAIALRLDKVVDEYSTYTFLKEILYVYTVVCEC